MILLLPLLLFTACSENDPEAEIEPLEYSSYSGYWKVDMNAANSRASSSRERTTTSGELPPNERQYAESSNYNLSFHKLNDWLHFIPVSNDGYGEGDIAFGDEVVIQFAIANTGSEMFSVYLNASREAEITILWDGVQYDVVRMLQLQANYFQTFTIPLDNFYGDLDFSPGTHEVELILDVPGQSDKSVSRTALIKTPDLNADTFEFTETLYFIENDGQVTYGNLSHSGNMLTLHGYGSLEIIEENDEQMIVEVVLDNPNGRINDGGFLIGLDKLSTSIPDSKMTNLLCYDPWVLVESSSSKTPLGQEWMFHRSGNYDFINTASGFSRKAWGYESETSINYGFTSSSLNGTTEILEISQTRMVMNDGFNSFTFERVLRE